MSGISVAFAILLSASGTAMAQNAATIHGAVTDPSAAVIPGAVVQITGNGTTRNAKSDGQGKYTLTVAPGTYSVRADAKGFVTFLQPTLTVTAGQAATLDISLQIASEAQQVSVSDQAAGQLSVDASSNVGALVLKNEDLDALPDDPDDLQADLEALAGPAAGPNGAQFFVDGFSGGQLPPKSSIREIRINSNPFSSEFDRPGFGRIEILTKPGTDSFHGSAFANYGDRILRHPQPVSGDRARLQLEDARPEPERPDKQEGFVLPRLQPPPDRREFAASKPRCSTAASTKYHTSSAFPTPNRFWFLTPRVDYQINQNNTLVLRYSHIDSSNVGGVGGFNLPTQATTSARKPTAFRLPRR